VPGDINAFCDERSCKTRVTVFSDWHLIFKIIKITLSSLLKYIPDVIEEQSYVPGSKVVFVESVGELYTCASESVRTAVY
jgi:hypothetical protein